MNDQQSSAKELLKSLREQLELDYNNYGSAEYYKTRLEYREDPSIVYYELSQEGFDEYDARDILKDVNPEDWVINHRTEYVDERKSEAIKLLDELEKLLS